MHRLGFKLGDIILITCILSVALMLLLSPLFSTGATEAEIVFAETGTTQVVSLKKNAIYPITSRGISLSICVEDGNIFVSAANCRDGVCKMSSPISRAGQTIVCAPAGVIVRVRGEEAIVDGIAG